MVRSFAAASAVTLLLVAGCAPSGPAASPAPPAANATQPCASGGLAMSPLQSAAPTPVRTPATTTAPPAASPAAASPTPTLRPAPTTDRVGFPEDYQTKFKFAYAFDRRDAKSVSYICFNDVAATVRQGQPFPHGSVVVFESWRPKQDAQGNLVYDPNGHMIRESLNAIFVMRKEQGFGEAYQTFRTGEWEYVAYRPDRSYQTTPQMSGNCAACHSAGSHRDRDWTFRAWDLPFTMAQWAQAPLPVTNEVSLNRMAFFPATLTVRPGTTVTWTNSLVDKTDHTVNANDNSFRSATLRPGESFTTSFTDVGTYLYFCSLHPDQMRARVEVKN
ncbi:MAG TPA: cytochrome P460 family protein [Candidatus Limnocylindria bacterium]|jgi:plastocyanin|nr:cytochrome P460 family protein [Candidatus Limnocylindria bacterium]